MLRRKVIKVNVIKRCGEEVVPADAVQPGSEVDAVSAFACLGPFIGDPVGGFVSGDVRVSRDPGDSPVDG